MARTSLMTVSAPEPTGEAIVEQGIGWKNRCGKGNAEDTVTSGLEGAWTATPTQWSIMYLANLFAYEWEQTRSPAGALQWQPKDGAAAGTVPDAHLEGVGHAPVMFTTDLSLKFDPSYREISQRFLANPEEFELAFAKAWFKLTHRDMGPKIRYLGDDVPDEVLAWQDPLPARDYKLISDRDVRKLKAAIAESGLDQYPAGEHARGLRRQPTAAPICGVALMARVSAWAPQNQWAINNPAALSEVITVLEEVQDEFNSELSRGKQVSLADVVVLAGNVAVEQAAEAFGVEVSIPFTPGRVDATEGSVDVMLDVRVGTAPGWLPKLHGRSGLYDTGPSADRQGRHAEPDRGRDDRITGWSAWDECQRGWKRPWRVDRPPRRSEQ